MRGVEDLADRVDMTLHQMSTETVLETHRTFEVDRITGLQDPRNFFSLASLRVDTLRS